MLVQNFIKIVCCLIAKVLHTLSLYKTYGILRQEEEEKKKLEVICLFAKQIKWLFRLMII